MRAAFLAAVLLPTLLFACSGDFTLCKQKFNDARVAQSGALVIPVSESRLLIYTSKTPKAQIERSNPFLGLYIVKATEPFAYPFAMNRVKPLKTIAIDGVIALPGKVVEGQNGLNRLGRFEHPLADPAIITDACCILEGIITKEGIIEKAYIRHFLESEGAVAYGDAGFRLQEDKKRAIVESTNPFMAGNPFRKGDQIIAYDGEKVKSAAWLMQKILLSSPGSPLAFTYMRQGNKYTTDTVLQERLGGGMLSDTYLEHAGIFFDREMTVTSLDEGRAPMGLAVGDKLLQVNTDMIAFDDEVRMACTKQEEKISLLFERNGFQFFVHIPFQKK
ncbi:MAG: PDZ domain-containing protein [Sulfurimonadaceae bacterium]|nr:PDZ domain-containing protein [Sulfurimonadaceae bacterium]